MAKVGVDGTGLFRQTHSPSWLDYSRVGGHLALSLQSSNKPGELSQLYNARTINIISVIIIIIIIIINRKQQCNCELPTHCISLLLILQLLNIEL